MPTPTLVADLQCEIGENPLWHPTLNLLLFLDIPPGKIHAYDPIKNTTRLFSQGRTTGGMLHHHDGNILLFQDGSISRLTHDGKQTLLADNLCPGNQRFNDVTPDPIGRVFAGTLGGDGKLLRFDLNGKPTTLLSGLGVPNGMAFTPDHKHLYFTDSAVRKLYLFDYDIHTGNLSNQRTFADIPPQQGVPDGMTIDAEGYIWTAIWFGARIKRYSPTGKLDREVHFPVRQTSAITFAGPDLADMYITSAGTTIADSMAPISHDLTAPPFGPRGGPLFKLTLPGITGTKPLVSRITF